MSKTNLEKIQIIFPSLEAYRSWMNQLISNVNILDAVLVAFLLYFSGSVLLNWSSPAVRWAFYQYQHSTTTASSLKRKRSHGILYIFYLLQNSMVALVKRIYRVSFAFGFHLPPFAFALLFLTPYCRFYYFDDNSTDGSIGNNETNHSLHFSNKIAQSVLDELATRCFRCVAVLVAISWSHEHYFRKRRLIPLPLPNEYRDLDRALLPPFLPEEDEDDDSSSGLYREAVMDYLVSLHETTTSTRSKSDLGYALVTGASQGIGRAIAVELARFGFPLILVARNRRRLEDLAKDLKECYGIHCCIIVRDLLSTDASDEVYEIVQKAGLSVDVLINNAGVASQGISFDVSKERVDEMLVLNVHVVSRLTHLFGRDMKNRRRGRIMIVSSLCGVTAGIASVAVYSATKAFERSLSTSLALEMESFGVGVTCLLPGAVRCTEFCALDISRHALVWKIPFCSTTPPQVASQGIRALLRGETELIVGSFNRIFAKVLQPLLPQRFHNLIATIMWNPFPVRFNFSTSNQSSATATQIHRRRESDMQVNPRLANAQMDSEVLFLSGEGWTAQNGWKTETECFEDMLNDLQSLPAQSN